jgi:Ser/Thr protein kinase RdoA (MazF antagonist)
VVYDEAYLASLQRAVRAALPVWSLPPDADLRLLCISENATYLAEDPATGTRRVLRVHRPGYHSEDEIRSELAWIADLRASGAVQTPAPVPGLDGDPVRRLDVDGMMRNAVAFEHVPGRAPDETDDLPAWFRVLGGVTARIHAHARGWKRPPGFQRKIWDFTTMLGEHGHWGQWRAGLGLDGPGTVLLERTAGVIQQRLARYGKSPDRFGLVHADLRLANLLVDQDALRIIDFDDCGFSWYAYDFAAAISFFEHDPIVPALLDAWVEGYRAVAPLAPDDVAEIQTFVLLRRILLIAWVASHAETPTAQSMGVPYTESTYPLAEAYLSSHAKG